MADRQAQLGKDGANDSDSRISSVPLLGDGFQEQTKPNATMEQEAFEASENDTKTGKRRFWSLGKKTKEDEKLKKKKDPVIAKANSSSGMKSNIASIRPASPVPGMGHITGSSHTPSHPYNLPSSPGHNLDTASPGPPSPASSQIFERSVQEESLAAATSPAIPAHIATENHIPPVLDASSAAITDNHLDPDEVEIVMHAAHQPAAVTVTGAGPTEHHGLMAPEEILGMSDNTNDETASTYGALDSTDVRRLSFISFADVVHAEHVDHGSSMAGSGILPALSHNRSPSPARSPLSSQALGGSPVLSSSASSKGLTSPFAGHSPPSGGELTIETMRQALRKTGSGDLSGARSGPTSAIGNEEGAIDSPIK